MNIPQGRKVKVIDPHKQPRIRCEECGRPEMHIYKLDPSLYFCGNCAHKTPIQNVKHSLVIVPPKREEGTFIAQVPSNREPNSAVRNLNKKKGPIIDYLRNQQALDVVDFLEISPQPD